MTEEYDVICRLLDTEGRFMQKHQWAIAAVLLVVGYYIGTKYPNFWTGITAKL
jgi:hypothetical protein